VGFPQELKGHFPNVFERCHKHRSQHQQRHLHLETDNPTDGKPVEQQVLGEYDPPGLPGLSCDAFDAHDKQRQLDVGRQLESCQHPHRELNRQQWH